MIVAFVALGVIVCLMLIICGFICRCLRKSRGNDKVMILAEENEMEYHQPGNLPN